MEKPIHLTITSVPLHISNSHMKILLAQIFEQINKYVIYSRRMFLELSISILINRQLIEDLEKFYNLIENE